MLTAIPFNSLNTLYYEVNVSDENTPPTMYAVDSADRLKLLMERTGTGQAVTSRKSPRRPAWPTARSAR